MNKSTETNSLNKKTMNIADYMLDIINGIATKYEITPSAVNSDDITNHFTEIVHSHQLIRRKKNSNGSLNHILVVYLKDGTIIGFKLISKSTGIKYMFSNCFQLMSIHVTTEQYREIESSCEMIITP